MINDFGPAVRRPRRRRWQRDPRVVVAGLATAAVGFMVLGGEVYGALNVGEAVHVTVRAGDSLWTIASAHYQSGDIREHIDQIVSLNHLPGSSITPGEDLLLPAP
jgi:LysM domain